MPYENMISCRLSDRDLLALGEAVAASGLTQSGYLRALLRIPPEAARQDTVYVVDGRTLAKAATELVRWGRHYNQAVHVLNTLALLERRGRGPDAREAAARLGRVAEVLEEVEAGRRDVEFVLCEVADSIAVRGD